MEEREGERMSVKYRKIDIEREGKRSQFNITLTQKELHMAERQSQGHTTSSQKTETIVCG